MIQYGLSHAALAAMPVYFFTNGNIFTKTVSKLILLILNYSFHVKIFPFVQYKYMKLIVSVTSGSLSYSNRGFVTLEVCLWCVSGSWKSADILLFLINHLYSALLSSCLLSSGGNCDSRSRWTWSQHPRG